MNLKQDWSKIFLLIIIGFGLSHLFLISYSLKIDYWDGFAQLINAQTMISREGDLFSCFTFRPLFVSLANIPIVALKYFGISSFTILKLSRLFSLLLGILLIAGVYLFLRNSFTSGVALLTTLLFSLNRLFIHYAPFTMTDIPASLFYLFSIFLYLKLRRNGSLSHYTCFIILVAFTLLVRLNMILLLATILLSEAMLSFREKRSIKRIIKDRSLWKILFFLAISCGLFISIHFIALVFLLKGSFTESLKVLGHNYLPSISSVPTGLSKNLEIGVLTVLGEYLSILIKSSGLLLLILSGLGCVVGLIRKRDEDLVCLLWFLLFFFVMSFAFRHRESRYILPLLFPLYYFCAHLFDLVYKKVVAYFKHKRVILILMSLLVTIQPMSNALSEHLHFWDAIYRTTFVEDVNKIVRQATLRGNKVYWWGKWQYPLYPRQRAFIKIDANSYRYDFSPFNIYFLSGVMPRWIDKNYLPFCKKVSSSNYLFLKSGDICLLALCPEFVSLRIRRIELILEERNNISYFRNKQMGDLFILQQKEEDLVLKPIKPKIKGAELYLISDKGIITKGWTRLDQQENILIKGDDNKEIKKMVLIVPLIEGVFCPMGRGGDDNGTAKKDLKQNRRSALQGLQRDKGKI